VPGVLARSAVRFVDDGMAAPASDQPPVDRERHHPGDRQGEGQRAPQERVGDAAAMAPGMSSSTALSTISMVVIDAVSAAVPRYRGVLGGLRARIRHARVPDDDAGTAGSMVLSIHACSCGTVRGT
jgi:hypothetical protein